MLKRRGLPGPGTLVPLCGVSAAVGAIALGAAGASGVLIALAGFVGAVAPVSALLFRARVRRSVVEGVWPDLVDHLVASLRAGSAIPEALLGLRAHAHPLLGRRFAMAEEEWRTTGRWGLALDRLKTECADPDADRVIEIVRLAYDVGGAQTLTVLRELSRQLREDGALRGELRSRRSWVVNTARLAVATPWIVLFLLFARPEGATAFGSPSGAVVIVVGFVACVLAYRIVVRLGASGVEPRWLA